MQLAQVLGQTNQIAVLLSRDKFFTAAMANEEASSIEIAAAAEASARRLGLQYLREDQKEAVVSFALGEDLLVLLHTGSGRFSVLFLVTVDHRYARISMRGPSMNCTRPLERP